MQRVLKQEKQEKQEIRGERINKETRNKRRERIIENYYKTPSPRLSTFSSASKPLPYPIRNKKGTKRERLKKRYQMSDLPQKLRTVIEQVSVVV